MDLSVNYNKCQNSDDAYSVVKTTVTPDFLKQFGISASIKEEPENAKMTASGKGFDIDFYFKDSQVEIDLSLGFLLKPLKGKVLNIIERELVSRI